MTTEVKDVVARVRAQMAPLKLAADIARPSADGYTYLNDSARKLLLELDQNVHELAIAATAAESRATAAEGRVALLEEALTTVVELLDSSIETHRFNAQHMIAEDTLVDAWGMLNMAREQFDTDANQLITIREAARAALAKGGQ